MPNATASDNGSPPADAAPPADQAAANGHGFLTYEELTFAELKTTGQRDTFFTPDAKALIGKLWQHEKARYVEVKTNAQACGIFGKDFDALAEACAQQGEEEDEDDPEAATQASQDPSLPHARAGPAPTDPYACPALPVTAAVNETLATEAAPWLDEYTAFSQRCSPG